MLKKRVSLISLLVRAALFYLKGEAGGYQLNIHYKILKRSVPQYVLVTEGRTFQLTWTITITHTPPHVTHTNPKLPPCNSSS